MPEITFRIGEKDAADAWDWVKKHPCKLRNSKRMGAIGGKTSFYFTDTTIGQIQVVKCGCGEEFLISRDL